MEKNSLLIILVFFLFACTTKENDYIIIHSLKNEIKVKHFFHKDSTEYARVYGNTNENDSIKFTKRNDDLLVNEFFYDAKYKKRLNKGNITYINYYISTTDIKFTDLVYINVLPIKKLDFLKNEKEIEIIIKENCLLNKTINNRNFYFNCDFIFPDSNSLEYLPSNSKILSGQILKDDKNMFQEISIKAKYFDVDIFYKRCYYYEGKRVTKIKTSITDSITTSTTLDTYSIINL